VAPGAAPSWACPREKGLDVEAVEGEGGVREERDEECLGPTGCTTILA
jgi:hypothetical protein